MASGELDSTIGGAPTTNILGSPRRTLYSKISRSGDRFDSDAFLRLFGFPAPQSTSAKRAVATVPQQYLFMMNSSFMQKRAQALAQSIQEEKEPGGSHPNPLPTSLLAPTRTRGDRNRVGLCRERVRSQQGLDAICTGPPQFTRIHANPIKAKMKYQKTLARISEIPPRTSHPAGRLG